MEMAKKQARGVTRNEILDAGMSLFWEKGAQLTVKDVADAANVSRQMVYQYFKSRGGLLIELARRKDEMSKIKEMFFTAMKTVDPKKRISEVLDVWLNYVSEIYELANELIRSRYTDKEAEAAYLDRMAEVKTWFKSLIMTLYHSQNLNKKYTLEEAVTLMSSMFSFQMYELLHKENGWTHSQISTHLKEMIIQELVRL